MGDVDLDVKVKFRIWIEVGSRHLIGPGGYEILKALEEAGSLSGAARRLGMSYRFVWNYVKRMEGALGIPVVNSWKGGRGRGGTELTPVAKELLRAYEEMVNEVGSILERWEREVARLIGKGAK